jgi:prepilin-type N-terminal cleavage/methylation domain-containing protein
MKLNNKGFTLVEVLAIIVIISILGGIAIPSVLSSINNSKIALYNIMISNIVTASQALYEEIEYNKENTLYNYNGNDGTKTAEKIEIKNTAIETNLQTLVSNGFLEGTCQENNNNNCVKVLIDPKTKNNIGECGIIITKSNSNKKISYIVTQDDSNTNANCPSTYKKEVK